MTIRFEARADQVRAGMRLAVRARRRGASRLLGRLLSALFLAPVALSVILPPAEGRSRLHGLGALAPLWVGGLLFLLIGSNRFAAWAMARGPIQTITRGEVVTWRLDPEGIEEHAGGVTTRYEWPAVVRIAEDDRAVVVFAVDGAEMALTSPARAWGAADRTLARRWAEAAPGDREWASFRSTAAGPEPSVVDPPVPGPLPSTGQWGGLRYVHEVGRTEFRDVLRLAARVSRARGQFRKWSGVALALASGLVYLGLTRPSVRGQAWWGVVVFYLAFFGLQVFDGVWVRVVGRSGKRRYRAVPQVSCRLDRVGIAVRHGDVTTSLAWRAVTGVAERAGGTTVFVQERRGCFRVAWIPAGALGEVQRETMRGWVRSAPGERTWRMLPAGRGGSRLRVTSAAMASGDAGG